MSTHIFISHSWKYDKHRKKLLELLDAQGFDYKDYSVPLDDPIHTNGTDVELREAIKRKISPSSIVIILAGVYASYSKWIKKEIDIAQNSFSSSKPILAVEYWGSERNSKVAKDNADKIVKWTGKSIVTAIEELTP